ncbi:uncharacterized protein LOC135923585 isoform X2 [Gordionus sp. m RMFG-2023]|uniref:uncharacterized protein LOC135923585 isoform X2 n=1 Tax=Gordionus sp. m RMFG-2023 TaxID=3053472 RepID=UPI0031FD1B4E
MTFLNIAQNFNIDRFSFLYLDPGEIYFESFAVISHPNDHGQKILNNDKQRGHLRLCSKSFIYEPVKCNYPLCKVLFKNCEKIDKWQKNTTLFAKAEDENIMHIIANYTINIKENNKIGPYKFTKLARSCTLNSNEHSLMITTIMDSKLKRSNFEINWLDDPINEEIKLQMDACQILPLVIVPGRIILTSHKLYYQPLHNLSQVPDFKIRLSDITSIFKRRFKLRQIGVEIQCEQDVTSGSNPVQSFKHIYLSFSSQSKRESFHNILTSIDTVRAINTNAEESLREFTQAWMSGRMSNYDYLLKLNSLADRSFYDLTQYPVFPWVLSNYTSRSIDLTDPNIYRDLSKPMGALESNRLNRLKSRMNEMLSDLPDISVPHSSNDPTCANQILANIDKINPEKSLTLPRGAFLYGSHYSCPGFVLYYAIRSVPEHSISLLSGRFDRPDRIFDNIARTFSMCSGLSYKEQSVSIGDFKELTPQFYDCSLFEGEDEKKDTDSEFDSILRGNSQINRFDEQFLINYMKLDLGIKQDGQRVNDVVLPPWAYETDTQTQKDDRRFLPPHLNFVRIMRSALESEHVSRHLNDWIDLVFGYKQNGYQAFLADNLFHPLTYESNNTNISLNILNHCEPDNFWQAYGENEIHKRQSETQILEFGQTPKQIFLCAPHPQKQVVANVDRHGAALNLKSLQMSYVLNDNTGNRTILLLPNNQTSSRPLFRIDKFNKPVKFIMTENVVDEHKEKSVSYNDYDPEHTIANTAHQNCQIHCTLSVFGETLHTIISLSPSLFYFLEIYVDRVINQIILLDDLNSHAMIVQSEAKKKRAITCSVADFLMVEQYRPITTSQKNYKGPILSDNYLDYTEVIIGRGYSDGSFEVQETTLNASHHSRIFTQEMAHEPGSDITCMRLCHIPSHNDILSKIDKGSLLAINDLGDKAVYLITASSDYRIKFWLRTFRKDHAQHLTYKIVNEIDTERLPLAFDITFVPPPSAPNLERKQKIENIKGSSQNGNEDWGIFNNFSIKSDNGKLWDIGCIDKYCLLYRTGADTPYSEDYEYETGIFGCWDILVCNFAKLITDVKSHDKSTKILFSPILGDNNTLPVFNLSKHRRITRILLLSCLIGQSINILSVGGVNKIDVRRLVDNSTSIKDPEDEISIVRTVVVELYHTKDSDNSTLYLDVEDISIQKYRIVSHNVFTISSSDHLTNPASYEYNFNVLKAYKNLVFLGTHCGKILCINAFNPIQCHIFPVSKNSIMSLDVILNDHSRSLNLLIIDDRLSFYHTELRLI